MYPCKGDKPEVSKRQKTVWKWKKYLGTTKHSLHFTLDLNFALSLLGFWTLSATHPFRIHRFKLLFSSLKHRFVCDYSRRFLLEVAKLKKKLFSQKFWLLTIYYNSKTFNFLVWRSFFCLEIPKAKSGNHVSVTKWRVTAKRFRFS